ncbi:MAG: hypothetical protein ABGY24_08895 [bacterium]
MAWCLDFGRRGCHTHGCPAGALWVLERAHGVCQNEVPEPCSSHEGRKYACPGSGQSLPGARDEGCQAWTSRRTEPSPRVGRPVTREAHVPPRASMYLRDGECAPTPAPPPAAPPPAGPREGGLSLGE